MSGLRILDPGWLLLLLPVAGLLLGHVRMAERRRQTALRYTNVELVRLVLPARPGLRRHLVAGLFLSGLVAGVVAMARPAIPFDVERQQATVMLAMDVSPSMMATDVEPTRLVAAVSAARRFIDSVPDGFSVGITTFAGTALVAVPPTTDRALAGRVLDRLQFRSETAIGDALIASVDAARAMGDPEASLVILMSDGASTTGTSVEEALDTVHDADVPVSTIAFGTEDGSISLSGETITVPPDPDTLARIADRTGGEFSQATTGEELAVAYQQLGGKLQTGTVVRELYAVASAVAVLLLVASAAASLRWFGRIV
jgi:Ca-activated chloride channel family protein